jgi:hypothetical protein
MRGAFQNRWKTPMPIATSCSDCGRSYKLSDHLAGRRAKCRACGNIMQLPAPPPTASSSSEEPEFEIRLKLDPLEARARSAAAVAAANEPVYDSGPPLDGFAELEATGRANQFSALPPPVMVPPAQNWYVPKKRETMITDADPRVAEAYQKKISRRAMLAGGGAAGAGGIGGAVYIVLRMMGSGARAYNRSQNNSRSNDDSDDNGRSSSRSRR